MADTADEIRQEIDQGRQDIAHTRAAIAETLTILEARVKGTVETVKHTFDLHYQVKQRPWLMFGAALLVGHTLGRLGRGTSTPTDVPRTSAHPQPQQSIVGDVKAQVRDDLATIKWAARGAVISTLWAMAKQVLLAPPRPQIGGVMTQRGGERVDSALESTNRGITRTTNGQREVS